MMCLHILNPAQTAGLEMVTMLHESGAFAFQIDYGGVGCIKLRQLFRCRQRSCEVLQGFAVGCAEFGAQRLLNAATLESRLPALLVRVEIHTPPGQLAGCIHDHPGLAAHKADEAAFALHTPACYAGALRYVARPGWLFLCHSV